MREHFAFPARGNAHMKLPIVGTAKRRISNIKPQNHITPQRRTIFQEWFRFDPPGADMPSKDFF
jgi:hypothetical protein